MPPASDKPKRPKTKPTWSDVKTKLANYDRDGLMHLVADLYAFHKDNQSFLRARLALGVNPLDNYKKRIGLALAPDIYSNRRADISVATAKKAISEYTKAIGDPLGVLELRVFWCETAVAFSMEFGYADEGYFDALVRQYRDACQTLSALDGALLEEYILRLENVRDDADMGYGVHDDMGDLLGEALLKLPTMGEARVPQLGED
jgi:hypothetical protein